MITIYHNPRCSKSRICLQLLQQFTNDIEIIDYLNQPPSLDDLRTLARELGLRAMIRDNETIYKDLGLVDADDNQLLSALRKYPQLLQRPIVIINQQPIIARPPEKVLELLNE